MERVPPGEIEHRLPPSPGEIVDMASGLGEKENQHITLSNIINI
jgi:hypothetical protein